MFEPLWPLGSRPRSQPFFINSGAVRPAAWPVDRERRQLDWIAVLAGVGWFCGGLPQLRLAPAAVEPEEGRDGCGC